MPPGRIRRLNALTCRTSPISVPIGSALRGNRGCRVLLFVRDVSLAVSLGPQLFIKRVEGVGDDADLAENRHVIRVAGPAGDDVGVDVPRKSRAGADPEVEPNVESLSPDDGAEDSDGVARRSDQVAQSRVVEFLELADMLERRDHQVAVGVGEAVHHDEAGGGAPQDVMCAIRCRIRGVTAEEAGVVAGVLGEGPDVLHPPRRPEVGVKLRQGSVSRAATLVRSHRGRILEAARGVRHRSVPW